MQILTETINKIATFPLAVKCAAQGQRVCLRIIRQHMQHHYDDASENGEQWILSKVAPQCERFVDVGANAGDFTSAFLSRVPRATGLVFDPSSAAHQKLKERFERERSVRVIQKAVSDFCGESVFYEEPNLGLASSLSQTWSRSDAEATSVKVSTLDEELAGWGGADYVKIDAEGHDLGVLRGAKKLLSQGTIRFLQFEYHTAWAHTGATLKAALDLLSSFGYSLYLLKGEGLYQPNYQTYGEYFSYSNYFSVSPADHKLISGFVRGKI